MGQCSTVLRSGLSPPERLCLWPVGFTSASLVFLSPVGATRWLAGGAGVAGVGCFPPSGQLGFDHHLTLSGEVLLRWIPPRAGFAKNRALGVGGILEWFLSPFPCQKHRRFFFSIYREHLGGS